MEHDDVDVEEEVDHLKVDRGRDDDADYVDYGNDDNFEEIFFQDLTVWTILGS